MDVPADILSIASSPESAAHWWAGQRAEFKKMREVMHREGGLLNIPQAALLLGVSRERVRELMKLDMLKRFDFLGHVYLSFNQVLERCEQALKAGRPRRTFVQRLKLAAHATALHDLPQIAQGGFDGGSVDPPKKRAKKQGLPAK
jgi:hypothetical protein